MICPKCGKTVDVSVNFCDSCGAKLNEVQTDPETLSHSDDQVEDSKSIQLNRDSVQSNTKIFSANKQSFSIGRIIGLIIGTALIFVGINRITGAGTSLYSTEFGADFYTYAYKGIVKLSEQLVEIDITLGWIIVAIGAAIDAISVRDL